MKIVNYDHIVDVYEFVFNISIKCFIVGLHGMPMANLDNCPM